jgi:hypothetical protein
MRLFLRSHNLLHLIEKPLDENADESTKAKSREVASILTRPL